MKKFIVLLLMACFLLGNSYNSFSGDAIQPNIAVEPTTSGGESDVGPPHESD